MKINWISTALLGLGLAFITSPVMAKVYLAAPVHPHNIAIIDAERYAVTKMLEIEDSHTSASTLAVSPDGRYVYALANGSESVMKIDIESGENVARLDMSQGNERVKAIWGMALSNDGKTLALYQNPVKLLLNEYKVEPTRIAYYDTATLQLKHVSPAPRQIVTLAFSTDDSKLYGMGRQMYVFDASNGQQIDEMPIQSWSQDKHLPPDVLNVWSQYETSNMIVAPYYAMLRDGDEEDPETYRTGLYTLNLETGEYLMQDIEATDSVYFSATASPDQTRAFAVYNVLQSFDLENGKALKQVPLEQTHYTVHVTPNGKELWVGGAGAHFSVYDTETLEKLQEVWIPNGGHMSNNAVRMFTANQ